MIFTVHAIAPKYIFLCRNETGVTNSRYAPSAEGFSNRAVQGHLDWIRSPGRFLLDRLLGLYSLDFALADILLVPSRSEHRSRKHAKKTMEQ